MKRIWRENSLSIVTLGVFLLFLIAQSVSGYRVFQDDQQEHGEQPISYTRYLTSGHFIEATFENWESEFLQMGAYVLLTVALRQKGSAESKSLDQPEPVDHDPREEADTRKRLARCDVAVCSSGSTSIPCHWHSWRSFSCPSCCMRWEERRYSARSRWRMVASQ